MKRLAFLLLFLCSIAKAEWSDWSDKDKGLYVATTALLIADWQQTSNAQMLGWREMNPFLGVHPSQGKINTYFGSWLIGNYFIADYLGSNRTLYFGVMAGVQGVVVLRNYQLGIRFKY